MIQKYSNLRALEVFFKEPTSIHFIREISREISLAPTSVRLIINDLLKEDLIKIKKSKPFNGYTANRENDLFIFYKRAYNLASLFDLKQGIIEVMHPSAIVLFGSYSRGEDIEESDIDILVVSKVKKPINFEKLEKELERKINIIVLDNLKKLDEPIVNKVYNGIVLHGEI